MPDAEAPANIGACVPTKPSSQRREMRGGGGRGHRVDARRPLCAGPDGKPIPTHITERMVAYSRRTQAYEKRKKEATAVPRPPTLGP